MAATAVVGIDCKAYRNTATYGSPTWNEITIAQDLNIKNTKTKVEASRRAKRNKEYLPGMRDIEISFGLLADPGVDDFDALQTAHDSDTLVDFAICDGAVAATGTRMLRLDAYVFEFSRNEGMEDAATANVVIAPAYSTSHTPTYSTVS